MAKKSSKSELEDLLLGFWIQVSGLRACANLFVPAAGNLQKRQIKEFSKELKSIERKLASKVQKTREKGENQYREAKKKFGPWLNEDHSDTLSVSQFVYLFARYDAFLGSLLEHILTHKTELHTSIEKTFVYDEVADLKSVAEIKRLLIEKEVDGIRRDSYIDQFRAMENKFSIKTLRSFRNWPSFIEASQRRHLFIHCNGVVTRQYLQVCSREQYNFDQKPAVGDKLTMPQDYYNRVVDLVAEVGLKLGTTLWRALWRDDVSKCDNFLATLVLEILNDGRFGLAEEMADFAMNQKHIGDDRGKRIAIMNYAQSLKWNGKQTECKKLIDSHDWSACQDDFKLAIAVLQEDWTEAAAWMKRIGRKDDALVQKGAYIEWPLFQGFRRTEEFRKAFRSVYRQDFATFEVREQSPKGKG